MRPLIARRGPAAPPAPADRAPRYVYTPQSQAPAAETGRVLARMADPAPSRWSYRAQRLWLTPLFHRVVRTGVPLVVALLLIGGYFGNAGNRQAMVDWVSDLRRDIENRPEFRVNVLDITGATSAVTEDIRATMALDLPQSSFDIDLGEMRARVEALPAVATADIRLHSGGFLSVDVRERVPALIWQTRDGPVLLDAEGAFVAGFAERRLSEPLPNIAGEGADLHVEEALRLHAALAPLAPQLVGLVRMGERRWDVVLTEERRILLPADAPVEALDRVLALHDVTDLFGRDVVRVDLRLPERLTVQLSPEALIEYRRLRALEAQAQAGEDAG